MTTYKRIYVQVVISEESFSGPECTDDQEIEVDMTDFFNIAVDIETYEEARALAVQTIEAGQALANAMGLIE